MQITTAIIKDFLNQQEFSFKEFSQSYTTIIVVMDEHKLVCEAAASLARTYGFNCEYIQALKLTRRGTFTVHQLKFKKGVADV